MDKAQKVKTPVIRHKLDTDSDKFLPKNQIEQTTTQVQDEPRNTTEYSDTEISTLAHHLLSFITKKGEYNPDKFQENLLKTLGIGIGEINCPSVAPMLMSMTGSMTPIFNGSDIALFHKTKEQTEAKHLLVFKEMENQLSASFKREKEEAKTRKAIQEAAQNALSIIEEDPKVKEHLEIYRSLVNASNIINQTPYLQKLQEKALIMIGTFDQDFLEDKDLKAEASEFKDKHKDPTEIRSMIRSNFQRQITMIEHLKNSLTNEEAKYLSDFLAALKDKAQINKPNQPKAYQILAKLSELSGQQHPTNKDQMTVSQFANYFS